MTLIMFSSFVILTTITAAQANQCPDGGECASHDVSPNVAVSMLQTKLQTNVPGAAAEAAASEAPDATKSLDKKTLQLQNLAENPSSILTELSEMVSRGEAPPFDLVSGIKSIVQDALAGLQPLRVASDQVTTDYLNAIQLCNDQSKTEEGKIEQSDQRSVGDARSLHSACRDAESSMYDHNLTNPDSYCNKLGKFIHEATPLRMPSGMDRDSSVQILAAASTSKWCATSSLMQLDNGCTTKEEELKSKTADCLGKQQSFEGLFCLWKYALEANCKALATCHSNAVAAYSDHVTKTRTLVEKWDMETAALEKILCFCNVWRNEKDEQDNRSQHNATQFDVCKAQTHTPVPMDYGTPAEKVTCLLTSVANHPGTSNFVTQEYSSFDDFVVPVVPCVQATTAAPSTASPTTTQATTVSPTTAVPTTTQATTGCLQHGTGTALCKPGLGLASRNGVDGVLPGYWTACSATSNRISYPDFITSDCSPSNCAAICEADLYCQGFWQRGGAWCDLFTSDAGAPSKYKDAANCDGETNFVSSLETNRNLYFCPKAP